MTTSAAIDVFSAPTESDRARFQPAVVTGDTCIILPGGNVSISEAAKKIFSLIAGGQRLFYRGGKVHEIVTDSNGTVRFSPLLPAQFRSRLDGYGKVCAWRSGGNGEPVLKPTLCPEETAKALLESEPARNLLPNVELLSKCPILAKVNGVAEILGQGWHSVDGGVYVVGGHLPPDVPLADAVGELDTLIREFDFSAAGDRSRALASLVNPALYFGSWLRGPAPIDIGEADASQSGKTYRQKTVAAIYGETPNLVVQRSGGVGGLDESISQKLIDGQSFILFDNLRGRLDSPYLEAVLTASGPTPARVPHRGEIRVDPRRFMFQMTSNGVETTRDLTNRASIVRIRKRPSGFQFRAYPEGDLLDHVVANQAYYLGCVFSVVKEWVRSGCPKTTETRHSFRPWAQSLDWIVQNIFHAAPLLDGQEAASARVSSPGLSWLRAIYIKSQEVGSSSEFNATQLAEISIEHDILPPMARHDAQDQKAVALCIGKTLKGVFRNGNEIEIDGVKIYRITRYSTTAGKETPWYQFGGQPPVAATSASPPMQSALNISESDPF